MPVSTIVVTAGDPTANSYVTQAEADQYFADRLHASAWTSATDDSRKQALLWATKILDTRVKWKGLRSYESQSLDWPRSYVPDRDFAMDGQYGVTPFVDGDVYLDPSSIPDFLKWAQCEQALALLGEDITLDPATTGFSSISLPGLSFGIDRIDKRRVLPQPVRELVQPYGEMLDDSQSSRTARLVRT